MQLICEKAEHVHTEECLSETRVLSCGLEESEEHTHTDECYTTETAYICGQEEHSHDESCYTETEARTETTLICEKEEHVHGADCYDAPPAAAENPYFCGQIAHTHDENCYFEDGTLKCTIEEHVHTADCEIDPNAVSETEEVQFEETPSEGPVEENVLTADTTTMAAISTINAFSSDGAEVIITGVLPEGAEAKIDAVTLSEEELIAYFGEAKAAAMKDFVAYDIKIMVDGEEWQPDESVSVVVKEPAITVEEDENFAVAHVNSETEEVSDVEAVIDENGEVSFEAEGFSIYIFYTFTVDFHFGETTFSINGRTNILLSELFEELGIEFSAADAVNVVFSDDSLLAVEQLEGDWLLTSLEAFTSFETLTIEFADGQTLIIDVADAQTTYWQKVTSIDDTNANYLIVNKDSGEMAVGVRVSNGKVSELLTKANMTAVSGKPGYYTTTLGNEYWWKFSATGNSSIQTNVANSDYGIRLKKDTFPIGTDMTTNKLEYKTTDGYWIISRTSTYSGNTTTRYLRYNENESNKALESSTTAKYRFTTIYKQVNQEPEETPEAPAYYQRVSSIDANADHYLIVSVEGNYALKTGDSPYCSQVELAPVKGNPGYFEVSGVVNTMKWKFGTNGGSGSSSSVYNQSDNSIALRLGNSNFYGSATNLSRTYDAVNGTWTLANSSNYLINDNGEFKSSNSTDSTFRRNLLILKPVDTQLDIPEDVTTAGTVGSDGKVQKPSYPAYVQPSGAKTGSEAYGGSSLVTMSYASDKATSNLETQFIGVNAASESEVKANDGKVLTDKSVIYGADDYGAFSSYGEDTFGVTLSALGQEYLLTEEDRVVTPMDVVFVLDVSGSMGKPANGKDGETRRDAVVKAVNKAMNEIFANNPENRVGIALYSSGSWTLLDMDRYYTGDNPRDSKYKNNEYTYLSVEAASGTIDNSTEGYTYLAYQVFSGDLAEGSVLSNIVWGDGVDGDTLLTALQADKDFGEGEDNAFAACTTARDVAEVLAAKAAKASEAGFAENFADAIGTKLATVAATSVYNETNGKYEISGLAAGYYFVKNSAVPTDGAYTDYILQVVENTEVKAKADVPEVIKKIVEGEERVDENVASIGDVVKYEITATLPTTISDYSTYFYKFTDTLSKGLTYNDDVAVTVDGVDATAYFWNNATTYSATDGTTITVSIEDLLALKNVVKNEAAVFGAITKDTKVVITYTATLNENAVIDGDGNDNKVYLEYSNNANESGEPSTKPPVTPPDEPIAKNPTGKTPESKVITYTTELTVLKVDQDGEILTGAEFKLEGTNAKKVLVTTYTTYVEDTNGSFWKLTDGSYTEDDPETEGMDKSKYADTTTKYKKIDGTTTTMEDGTDTDIKAFVGADGKLTFTGLNAGDYKLTETTTPAGYNTVAPITVTVKFDKESKEFYINELAKDNDEDEKVDVDSMTMSYTVVNQKGTVLPETGGIGTTIFYICGSVLLIGAAILLVTKKRMSVEE